MSARSPRQHRAITAACTTLAVVVGLVPSVVALAGVRVDLLAFVLGFAAALGAMLGVRGLCVARGKERRTAQYGHCLSARTLTGWRMIDLRDLRSVRARRLAGRTWPPLDYVIVRDRGGACIAFSEKSDLRLIREAVTASNRRSPAATVRVSRPARAALGIEPLPGLISVLWALGSVEVLVLVALAFTIPALELSPH